jgi:hypothetical protein
VVSLRPTLHNLAGIFSVIAAVTHGGNARAEGKIEADFTASLAGVTLGKGSWSIDIGERQYQVSGNAAAAGVMSLLTSGRGSFISRGTVSGGRLVPITFSSTISTTRWTDRVRMGFADGFVKEVSADPPPSFDPERVPVSETQRRGVTDPVAASIVPVPVHGDPVSPEACQRNIPIFDGQIRYDLHLAFKRMEQAKAEKGYEGPVVVCSVHITPIAGYVRNGTAMKYVKELKDIEAWLAPIANTRMLMPFRISTPTPIGVGVMEATQFRFH